jgi:hypothetical protein
MSTLKIFGGRLKQVDDDDDNSIASEVFTFTHVISVSSHLIWIPTSKSLHHLSTLELSFIDVYIVSEDWRTRGIMMMSDKDGIRRSRRYGNVRRHDDEKVDLKERPWIMKGSCKHPTAQHIVTQKKTMTTEQGRI